MKVKKQAEAIRNHMLSFPKKEIVKEHEKLVKDLRSGNQFAIRQELKKQSKELHEYKRK